MLDEGSGIPEEFVDTIFEPFYQLKHNENPNRGVGLGLAIAKKIVASHSGKIWAKNRQPSGAQFSFTLPLAKGTQSHAE